MLRVVVDMIYRDDPIKTGTTLPKTAFHAEHIWQGLVHSGHLEEWDGQDAGELSDERPEQDPQE